MKLSGLKSIAACAVLCLFAAVPVSGSAQRYSHDDYRFTRDDIRGQVDATERESNNFRDYFEHNFRDIGHQQRWDRSDRYGHPEHEGRRGQMSLQDAIQNLDEDFERLRAEVDHNGITRRARDLMDEIGDHMRDVDVRIDRVADNYVFTRDRRWRYRSSELYNRWRDLRADINDLTRRLR